MKAFLPPSRRILMMLSSTKFPTFHFFWPVFSNKEILSFFKKKLFRQVYLKLKIYCKELFTLLYINIYMSLYSFILINIYLHLFTFNYYLSILFHFYLHIYSYLSIFIYSYHSILICLYSLIFLKCFSFLKFVTRHIFQIEPQLSKLRLKRGKRTQLLTNDDKHQDHEASITAARSLKVIKLSLLSG